MWTRLDPHRMRDNCWKTWSSATMKKSILLMNLLLKVYMLVYRLQHRSIETSATMLLVEVPGLRKRS